MYKALRFTLVSLLMMLCGTVFADEVTFDFTGNEGYGMTLLSGSTTEYNADPTTCTNGDVTLTLNGKTRWWKTNNGNQLRFYKGSSMTLNVESGTITKVELTASAPKNFSGDNYANGVWEGSAQSVTINCDITSSNTPVTVIKVTYTPGTSDTRSATSITLGDHATSGTVGESMNLPTATVCEVTGAPVSNATVTWESTNTDVATIANGKINFVAAGTSTIKASFAGDNTYKPSSASFTLTVNLPSAGTFYSFAELQDAATETSTPLTFVFNGQQVVFVNGSNAFLTDEKGYGVMIFTNGHGLKAGDKLTGSVDCNLVIYQGATEITGFSTNGLTITNDEVTPVEKTIGSLQFANQSTLVTLKDVMYESGAKVFYQGADSIVFYDKFKTNVTLEENHRYDVTGVLILYYDSKNSSTYLEICPRSANDVVDLGEVDIPDTPKYYVIGNMTEWKVNENYKMNLNAAVTSEEYMLETTFAAGDEIKVVKDGTEALVWYPADGGNYTIDAAGDYTVYFRPAGDGGNDWYYGCIYVYAKPVPTETDVTFDFNASDHAVSATGINDGDIVSNEVLVEGGVTMTVTPNAKGTANRYWGTNNGPQLRMYGGKIIIVAPEGKAIKKATFNNGKWSNDNTFNGEVASSKEWEGNSSNLVLEVAANTQLNNVVVTIGNKDNETTTYMATFTATFSTNADWNKVYAYAWTNRDTYAEKFLGEWPGTEITLDAETGKYSLTFTAAEVPAMILFNDGGSNQTADLDFVDGKDYEYDANAEQTVTVTFSTDLGWNKVCAYAYSKTGDQVKEFTASWPGDELQANEGVYTYSYTGIETPDSIIFNNGIKEGDGKDQTPEFMFQDGRHYTYNTLDKAREELRSFILEVEALYNDHKDDVPAESQQEIEDAIAAAWRVYWDSNATEESLAQAKDDLQAAMIKAQSDALGLSENVTNKFSQFEWVSDLGEVTVNKDNDLSQVLMNTTDGTGKVIYKTVTGLQNGTYDVKLEGGAIDDGTGTRVLLHDGEEGRVVLFANNVALSLPVRFSDQNSGTQHMELKNVVVSDGTMELGMQKLAPGSNWHLINIEKVKMLSYTKQVADEDGQNAHWQGVKKTILDDQSYSSVTDEPRETLQAADTKADIMAAIPAFYAAYVPVQSEDVYSVAGEPAVLFGAYWNEKATETEMTLNKNGLYEWSKENVTLAGGVNVKFKVVKNHDWAEAWPSSDYESKIQEDGVYTVVITFNDKTQQVNAEITKTGDAVIEPPTITSVELRGDFNNWTDQNLDPHDPFFLTPSETENVWTGTLDLTETNYDPKFKLVVNDNKWIGNNQMEIVAPDGWVDSAYDQYNDLILYHTNTGYNTYTVTATWDPNANADQGWTLTFEGKDAKDPVVMQDFSIIFTTNADWDEVYAYAWSGEGSNVNEILGGWPGTKMSYSDRYTRYELSFQAAEAPQWIIFNNGKSGGRNQTENLVFEDEKTYQHTVDADSELMAEAKRLAADADAVAVGKLIDAIDWANANNDESQLQDAIDAFNANNADQEKDETAKVDVDGWYKFESTTDKAGVCDEQYAPLIDTYDGRKGVNLRENYESTTATTGQIIYQNITGLTNGSYKVGFYANAFYTSGRGFDSPMEDGAQDVAYVFANEQKEFIVANIATKTEENNFRQFDVEVTDGNIKLGMGKEKAGTNWHSIQIYQLTWFTTAKEVYATDKAEMQNLLDEARVLLKDENKYEGKEELSRIIAESEQVLESNWYNIPEFEDKLQNLKDAIESYKFINRYINLAAGEYYIIDAESGKKMAAGHDWGTRGIVNEQGLDLTLTPYEDSRTVTIDSRVSNGGNSHFLGSNLYMDSSSWGWALEYQGFGFYILEPKDGKYINIDANDNLVLSDTPREFIIVTKDGVKAELLEEMATATAESPVDATFLITAPNFNRNDARNSAWNKYQGVSGDGHTTNISGGNQVNNCAEAYHTDFSLDQVLEDAPAGIYKLTAQGFYRQDGEETEDAPVFIIGAGNHTETGAIPVKTGNENNMNTASESFTAGNYTIEPIEFKYYGNEELWIGVEGSGVNQWVIFDNFQLTYYGPFETTYTIAGAFKVEGAEEETAEIFGETWNPALEANDMVKGDDGIYTKTFKDVELPAGTIYYKVAADHSWDYASWGFNGGNANYVITEKMLPAGLEKAVFDITFKFNPSQKLENGYYLTCEVVLDENTTGIMNVNREAIKNGNVYNLNGQKVNKIQKGLYIVNGRKMIQK